MLCDMGQKNTLPAAAVAALHRGQKIEAVKIVRAESGIDLKEAKQRVEQYLRTEPLVQASFAEMQARSGRTALWWISAICVGGVLVYLWWLDA